MKSALYIVGLVVAFFVGYLLATPETVEIERVEYDTMRVNIPVPYQIRMEKDISWLHIDTLPQSGVNTKVYEFKG